MIQQADLLIHASWILPVDPEERLLTDHGIAIGGGRILALLPSAQAADRIQARETLHLPGQVVLPGLINAHTHSPMVLLRGLADDLPLMTWLTQHIWPAEQRWVSSEMVQVGTRLAIWEMLRGGTTCFNDMYFYPEETARVADAVGIRAMVGMILMDGPTRYGSGPDGYLERGRALHGEFGNHPRIHTALAPHAPYSVSDAPLKQALALAQRLAVPIHIHLHETREEIQNSRRDHGGLSPLARLERLGVLEAPVIAVHMTQLDEEDLERTARYDLQVVHCPESNLKLASGFCPVTRLASLGVNVALGTDGAASNNNLDLLGELQTAALLAKGISGSAEALPAHRVLRMATLDGARALGIEAETGSLEVGKSADLIALDLGDPSTQPVHHPVSQIVYAASRDQVRHVWVAGRHLLRDGRPTTLDPEPLLAEVSRWGAKLHGERGFHG